MSTNPNQRMMMAYLSGLSLSALPLRTFSAERRLTIKQPASNSQETIDAAEAKRQRKNAKRLRNLK